MTASDLTLIGVSVPASDVDSKDRRRSPLQQHGYFCELLSKGVGRIDRTVFRYIGTLSESLLHGVDRFT